MKKMEAESVKTKTVDEPLRISKGLFFVHLYGCYEYTLNYAVSATLEFLKTEGLTPITCRPNLLSVVLDAEFRSLVDSGPDKRWQKRFSLLSKMQSGAQADLNPATFYYDLMNANYSELIAVWTAFCIDAPLMPDMIYKGRISELVENRNKVAHGRESPTQVGGAYSVSDLQKRFDDVSAFCTYLISTLDDHITKKRHLLPSPIAVGLVGAQIA